MATEIKLLHSGDEHILAHVADEVFDNPIDPDLTREFLADRRHHIAVAVDDGQVVGFASGVDYVHPDKLPELWINEVGVAPTHRRRGLGKALVESLLAEGRARGCVAAWVLTERGNIGAITLYKSAGGIQGRDGGLGIDDDILGFSFNLSNKRVTSSTS